MSKISWVDKTEGSPWDGPTFYGMLDELHVATIHEAKYEPGKWTVSMRLAPLPERLYNMTLSYKASERQAKASAQRIVNEYAKILTGGQ